MGLRLGLLNVRLADLLLRLSSPGQDESADALQTGCQLIAVASFTSVKSTRGHIVVGGADFACVRPLRIIFLVGHHAVEGFAHGARATRYDASVDDLGCRRGVHVLNLEDGHHLVWSNL